MLRIARNTVGGKPLKLKDGVYRQLKDREWIFHRAEKEMIFLVHASGAYGVVVRPEDVNWEHANLKTSKRG